MKLPLFVFLHLFSIFLLNLTYLLKLFLMNLKFMLK